MNISNWAKKIALLIVILLGGKALLGQVGPEPILGTPPIIENGRIIEFAYTDDNKDEDLIIRTNQERYMNWAGNITVYYSILNNSSKDQWIKTAFSLSDDTAIKKVVETVKEYKGEKEIINIVPIYSTSTNSTTTKEEITKTGVWESKLVKSFDVANPDSFQRKELKGTHASKINEFYLLAGKTKIFKAKIKYIPDSEEEEFFLEAFGSLNSYGHLDPWTYEQKFNTLNDGDLNGQDSWSGNAQFDVQTSETYEGAKAVAITNPSGNPEVLRNVTAVADGTVYFTMRSTVNNKAFQIDLLDVGVGIVRTQFSSNGQIQTLEPGPTYVSLQAYNANQWYVAKVTFNGTTDQHSISIHDGSSWSDYGPYTTYEVGEFVQVERINVWAEDGTLVAYFDTITPTDPVVAVARRMWQTIPN